MDTGSDIYLVQAVSNGHENSKPRRPSSCENTAAAAPPDMSKVARSRTMLLAALIIVFIRFFLFALLEHIFDRLGMLKTSPNLLRISGVAKRAI